jgi:hypothetical protein
VVREGMRGGGEMIQTLYAHINLKNKIKKEELMQKKKSGKPRAGAFVSALLISLKTFFFSFPYTMVFCPPPHFVAS